MKKNILKKFFIKLAKALDFELIDQNEFKSPTLEKKLNENLSSIKKSIVLPLGEVKLTRKVSSLLIIFRTNTNVEMWNQNRKRIFDKPKIEYVCRALYSVIKAIKFLKKNNPQVKVDLKIIDDKSTEENLSTIKDLLKKNEVNADIINHDLSIHENIINLETALEEMVSSYERISSQLKKELFICPADYPFLYMDNEKTNLLIGSKRHWRTTSKSLMTFMVSKPFIEKYWDIFLKTCSDLNDPWEKYFNEIYEKEVCISPVQSLTVHITNINSGYGLSPFIDYKKLWDDNNYK